MTMKLRLTILLILACFCGFSQVRINVPEPYGDNFIESELIQEVTFVPLKPEKIAVVKPEMEMKCDAGNFFILNNDSQCVYRFNDKGELMKSIFASKQKTALERGTVLTNPVKFNLNPYKKQVEIYSFENATITRFNYDGTSQGKVSIEINPSDFVRDATGNYWIYTGWNNKNTQYRLLRADAAGKTIDRKMRLISKCMPTEGFSFYATPTGICMWELFGNSTYLIKGDVLTETFRFNFGARNLMPDFHSIDPYEAFKAINETGYYTVKKYLENENYSYFFLNFTSMEQKEMFHILYDKKTQQTYTYTENSSIGAFDKAQDLTSENELIFLVSPRKIRQLLRSGVEFVPAAFASLDESIVDLRDPIILKIKLGSGETQDEKVESPYEQ